MQGVGRRSRAAPMFITPMAQRLRTVSAPSIVSESTHSFCSTRPLTPSSDGMSVAMRYIRLACVLLGTVRSMGNTSERSPRNEPSSSTLQRRTKAICSPLISMWSLWGSDAASGVQTMRCSPGAIAQRWAVAVPQASNRTAGKRSCLIMGRV